VRAIVTVTHRRTLAEAERGLELAFSLVAIKVLLEVGGAR
jgi:hypothetical protein